MPAMPGLGLVVGPGWVGLPALPQALGCLPTFAWVYFPCLPRWVLLHTACNLPSVGGGVVVITPSHCLPATLYLMLTCLGGLGLPCPLPASATLPLTPYCLPR